MTRLAGVSRFFHRARKALGARLAREAFEELAAVRERIARLETATEKLEAALGDRPPPPLEAHAREVTYALTLGVAAVYGVEVEGDVAEFGTMTGVSAVALAEAMAACDRHLGYALDAAGLPPKALHLFDSFEGLPEVVTEVDAGAPHVRSGVWAPGTCVGLSRAQLEERAGAVFDPERIRTFEGWFKDTLVTIPDGTTYSLVHIDSDLYESARDVLDYLFGHGMISEGALIFFDDWNCNRGSPQFGERRAWEECVAKYAVRYSDEGGYGLFSHKFIVHGYQQGGRSS